MTVACPLDLDTGRLRHEIQASDARVAADPSSEFHFHRRDIDFWTGGIAGALPEAEPATLLEQIGFRSVRIAEYFGPFAGTSKARVARKHGVRGVNVHALKS